MPWGVEFRLFILRVHVPNKLGTWVLGNSDFKKGFG